jgi:small subunit ribosomal protein S17
MSEETASTTAPEAPTAAAPESAAEGARNSLRKTRVGVVTSDKMSKTIVVEVERRVPHPRFKKIVRRTTKFHAHDEEEVAKIGDKVRIMETRPLSKTKRWRLLEVLAH